MKKAILVGIVVAGGVWMSAACSSDSGKNAKGTGGNSGINLGTGASGAVTGAGLVEITQEEADRLTGAACEGWEREPETGPAVVEFQVDMTQSMRDQTTSTGNQNKWQAMQASLPDALAALPANWAVGLAFFSTPNPGQCYQGRQVVPIAANTPDHVTALTNAIQQQNPNGYTPTEAAYNFALQQIQAFGSNNNYIVVVTDGVPTINTDAGCTLGGTGLAITQDAYNSFIGNVTSQTASTGVKTFWVGVPGSEELQQANYDPMYMLSRLAEASQTAKANCTSSPGTLANGEVSPRGTYCHYDMTQATDFATELKATIGAIAGGIISCDYSVPVSSDPTQTPPLAVTAGDTIERIAIYTNGSVAEAYLSRYYLYIRTAYGVDKIPFFAVIPGRATGMTWSSDGTLYVSGTEGLSAVAVSAYWSGSGM